MDPQGRQRDTGAKRGRDGRQFAALPLAEREGRTMVLLVTSRDTGRWVLPKGWAEERLSGPELAAKEAFEEAGLVGEVAPDPVGAYSYRKRLPDGSTLPCGVQVFPMRVERLLEDWPERRQRRRAWFTLGEAATAVEEGELAALLLRLEGKRIAGGRERPEA